MFESWLPKSNDHLPLTWWKQHPIYLAAVLAAAGAASMVVYAVLGRGLMGQLAFTVDAAFRQWHLWTLFTYVLVNPPSLWTLIGCYLLWSFGEAVERHLGRRAFVRLLLLLLAASPLLTTVVSLSRVSGMFCAGMMPLEFGVFIAFATLYPKAKISLIVIAIDAWILAAVFVGINALQCLAARDWISLLLLAGNVGTAFAFVRYETGGLKISPFAESHAKPAKSPQPAASTKPSKSSTGPVRMTDAILDKISREGMQSLTAEERRILERASEAMKRRK